MKICMKMYNMLCDLYWECYPMFPTVDRPRPRLQGLHRATHAAHAAPSARRMPKAWPAVRKRGDRCEAWGKMVKNWGKW